MRQRRPSWRSLATLLAGLTASPLLGAATGPAGNPYVHRLGEDGTLHLAMAERTGHPHFWWPQTLLNYRVVFDQGSVPVDRYRLFDATSGEEVPIQISDLSALEDGGWSATLSFFSDLPTGASRAFDFRVAPSVTTVTPPANSVAIAEEATAFVLNTGAIKVRVPKSQETRPNAVVPGPFEAVADAKGWTGQSRIISPRKAAQSITTEIIDRGPLFARVRVAYGFAGGASYVVTIKAARGCDFVEVLEKIDGLTKDDVASFELTWTNLTLTHRRGDEPINRPNTLFFRGEDPAFTGPPSVENPAEEFYFRLAHTAADNTINLTAVDFSDRKNARAIGLAVRDGSKWDDGEYSIWASNETLAVRFRYAEGLLHWIWPLAAGSRDTIVAAYNPETAGRAVAESYGRWQKDESLMAAANTGVSQAKSYMAFLNSRQGGMSLDAVKDWQLDYADAARRPAARDLPNNGMKPMESIDAYLKALWGASELVKVEGNWVSPVGLRVMSQWVVPGYNKWRTQMTDSDRKRVEALILFHAYFASREEVSPMRHVLKGHPNFMADWKYPLMAGAFLFPEHPLASEWADQFEKLLEIMGVFYVRPSVAAWEARGGRWTESIGTYNWAFIEPAIHANQLGLWFDGRDRWSSTGLALHGEYLAGIVTAPVILGQDGGPLEVKPGTPLTTENGFQRIHPPQGAHSSRRQVPGVVEDFGESLRRFAPLTAEHLLWLNQRPAGTPVNFEGMIDPPRTAAFNLGTNPRLVSEKFTGYGIVLRAAVGTPDEIAVFLQQIDKGPNYRWGFGNEGGCGDIYYYAGGKSYAGHLGEDAGDRRVTDAEFTSNTGVYKDTTFRGIGMNELTEPFYDLEQAQFAELLPRQGADAYAWPEYGARSVLLVGHDYILTFDVLNTAGRMAWSIMKGQDEMPTIIPIRGETTYRTTQTTVSTRGGTAESDLMAAHWLGGDRLTLVSHRRDIKVLTAKKGELAEATIVQTPESTDYVFQQRDSFAVSAKEAVFSGRAGVIRKLRDGRTELALFHGTRIGTDKLVLSIDNPDLGVSAAFASKADESAGKFFSRHGGTLTLSGPGVGSAAKFFVDGTEIAARREADRLVVALVSGQHRWQLTTGPVEPMAPEIVRSEALVDGARLFIGPVAGAEKYRIESSYDTGLTWSTAGESSAPEFALVGLMAPLKVHVRAVAVNRGRASRPGRDYPVYITGKPPAPPSGLRLVLGKDQVNASWGEILGAIEYVLCRRDAGAAVWQEIYRGRQTAFVDPAVGVVPAFAEPGLESAAERLCAASPVIYEYAVRAVDRVGEGALSPVANTDPSNWRNWYPAAPLVFKRQSAYWLPPYVRPEQIPPPHYPK